MVCFLKLFRKIKVLEDLCRSSIKEGQFIVRRGVISGKEEKEE